MISDDWIQGKAYPPVSFVDQMQTNRPMLILPQRPSLAKHVAETLRDGLERKLWQERLPGERDLSQQLNVSRPTLRAALAILEKEGYVRSGAGRRWVVLPKKGKARGVRTPVVRLLIPFRLQEAPQSLFYWIDKLRALLPAAGCALEIHSGGRYYSRHPEKELAQLTRQVPVSAWVVARSTEPTQRWFAEQQLPCIVAGSCYPGIHLPTVDYDNRAVAQHAASQLLSRRHLRLAMLLQTPELAGDFESEAGFNMALKITPATDATVVTARHDGTLTGIRRQLDRLLRLEPAPTGFFVLRAIPALAVASELTRRGFRLPADVAVISRDSDHFLGYFSPGLARYVHDPDLFARRLAGMVVQLAKEGAVPTRRVRLMPTFIKGETLD
jgi:LacI family transcriptional regulator